MDQICAKKKWITIKEKTNHHAEFNSPEPRTCWMFMAVSIEDRDKGLIHARLAFLVQLA